MKLHFIGTSKQLLALDKDILASIDACYLVFDGNDGFIH